MVRPKQAQRLAEERRRDKVKTHIKDDWSSEQISGREFAGYEEISKVLIAHPHASYERGLNENTNGLIRQYFPKDRDFRSITDEELMMAVKKTK